MVARPAEIEPLLLHLANLVAQVDLEVQETPSGHMQFGGKFDAVAIVVMLALHAQLRQCQGLLTYLLFADLKYGFDVDWHLMLHSG